MKLKGASILELSLTLSFVIVVVSSVFYFMQGITERINQAVDIQYFSQDSSQIIRRLQQLGDFQWGNATISSFAHTLAIQSLHATDNLQITQSRIDYSNGAFFSTTSDVSPIVKLELSHSIYDTSIFFYLAEYAAKTRLIQRLHLIRLALLDYNHQFGTYPPSRQLQYLVQSNILRTLPNNPYTNANEYIASNANITDWHYTHDSQTISLYAYTHPSIGLMWQY